MWMFHKHVYLSIAALIIAISASAQDGGRDANSLNANAFVTQQSQTGHL
jgi:hypothetical protein